MTEPPVAWEKTWVSTEIEHEQQAAARQGRR